MCNVVTQQLNAMFYKHRFISSSRQYRQVNATIFVLFCLTSEEREASRS